MKTKHTIESVKIDLQNEFKTLSSEWEECGDVNLLEYGGVRYRLSEQDQIEVEYFRGIDDTPKEVPDRLDTFIGLDELIDGLNDIWVFSDCETCGLSIGWAIMSLNAYNGFLSEESGWYFSEKGS
jgi:hypothetical protein